MTTRFNSPLEMQQIVVDAAEPGSMTAPDPATTRAAGLQGEW